MQCLLAVMSTLLSYSHSFSIYKSVRETPHVSPYFASKKPINLRYHSTQKAKNHGTSASSTTSISLSAIAEGPSYTPTEVISVNFFFSRKCNYSCKFCFHTAKSDYSLPLDKALEGIRLLKDAGCQKINFAGGEPFLHPFELGMMAHESSELGMAVSIISNASRINPQWMEKFGSYVDMLGVSLDSFDPITNGLIGRGGESNNKHVSRVLQVRNLCEKYNIKFKVNTVVNALNWEEDMNENIKLLNPMRWNVFQVLLLHGENSGENRDLRDSRSLLITSDMFQAFVDRHRFSCPQLVAEPNDLMQDSYLMLDEKMRFLNCQNGEKIQLNLY